MKPNMEFMKDALREHSQLLWFFIFLDQDGPRVRWSLTCVNSSRGDVADDCTGNYTS